jgi:uncharacterized protein (DUF427 family)
MDWLVPAGGKGESSSEETRSLGSRKTKKYSYPRDPYTRLDVIHSSRAVRVVIAGETVADTHRPVLLFETGLRTQYYISEKLDDFYVDGERAIQSPTTRS